MVQAFRDSAQPSGGSNLNQGTMYRAGMVRSMTALPSVQNHPMALRIRRAIVRMDETLAILESSSSPVRIRWEVNRVQVQLRDLDQLLNEAIILLQEPESSTPALSVPTLDVIYRLLNQLTDAFARLEGWHNVH